ncbi:hypothetical protein HK15_13270 [Acetobacter orientalis]|uniref:Uncharacterized protein n=1 Tax=Acetobacter orientalis TaxID=146474 RepID=A0A252B357_9PROT|nr:hypothetical protein [Acetobacter orientalis]OUI98808.1 hypothetical protein HK15_13270 [Acetobacter orientalis]
MTQSTNLFVTLDKVWFETSSRGSILMAMTNSPFVGMDGFEAPVLIGDQEFSAKFSFSGAISFDGENISRGLYRATELCPARSQPLSKPEMRLNLSGPPFPSPFLNKEGTMQRAHEWAMGKAIELHKGTGISTEDLTATAETIRLYCANGLIGSAVTPNLGTLFCINGDVTIVGKVNCPS